MLWKPALFKGKKVWAEVDEVDALVVQNGLVGIRYSTKEGSSVYRASSRNLQLESGASKSLSSGVEVKKTSETSKTSKIRKKFGSAGTRTASQKSAAQKDVRDFLEGLSKDTIRCFTDGSCVGNPGPSGTGVYIQLGEKEIKHYRYLGEGTNNKAELSAVYDALTLLEKESVSNETPIVVCTDSQYVVGILTKNWKAKANRELVLDLRKLVRLFRVHVQIY